jgi:lysophospholipase L1-like esterase
MQKIRLTALGDSFVEGRGAPVPGGYHGWVPRLAELLGLPHGAVRNLGTYQATTGDVVETQLPKVLAGKPPLIGVIVGVNDLVTAYEPQRFRRNLSTLFGSLRGMDTTVCTANYPDIPGNLPVPDGFRRLLRNRFDEANGVLAEVTAASRRIRRGGTGPCGRPTGCTPARWGTVASPKPLPVNCPLWPSPPD